MAPSAKLDPAQAEALMGRTHIAPGGRLLKPVLFTPNISISSLNDDSTFYCGFSAPVVFFPPAALEARR
jgi:hypothetical protein